MEDNTEAKQVLCEGHFLELEKNTTGTDYIKDNYEKLIRYCKKITNHSFDNAYAVLENVFIGIAEKELNGEWYGTETTVEPIVYTFLRNYVKKDYYRYREYDNRNKKSNEVSHIKMSNTEDESTLYHDIFEIVVSDSNLDKLQEKQLQQDEWQELMADLNDTTDEEVTTFGRNLIHKTLNEPMEIIGKIDMSLYDVLNEYERSLLYRILQLKIKMNREENKYYEQRINK